MNKAEKMAPAAASCGAPFAAELDALNKIAPPKVSTPRVPNESAITIDAQTGKPKSFRGEKFVLMMGFTDRSIKRKCYLDLLGDMIPATRHGCALVGVNCSLESKLRRVNCRPIAHFLD